MPGSLGGRPVRLAAVVCALVVGSAAADGRLPFSAEMLVLTGVQNDAAPMAAPRAPESLDGSLFMTELVAFLLKEALPDAREEYVGSPISSRLTDERTLRGFDLGDRGRFGRHCLVIVGRIFGDDDRGSRPPAVAAPQSFLPGVARAATTLFIARDLWSLADRRDRGDGPRPFSLEPRISGRRVEGRFVVRW
jgi:hypothetical protein